MTITYPKRNLVALVLHISTLSLLVSTQAIAQPVDGDKTISKKQVSAYLQRNKGDIIQYNCDSSNNDHCTIVCSSGGNDYIKANKVKSAFYGERRSSLNGSVIGYYLAVDVEEENDNRNIWATLQVESSCLFSGMAPVL